MALPKPPIRLKGAPTGRPGAVNGMRTVSRKEKDGKHTVLHEAHSEQPTEVGDPNQTGIAGVGMGLTIPGPDKSYMAARIDAYCYLPCSPTAEGVRAAMAVASEYVQEQLAVDSAAVQEFLRDVKR